MSLNLSQIANKAGGGKGGVTYGAPKMAVLQRRG